MALHLEDLLASDSLGKASFNPCRQVKKYEEHNERNRYLLQEQRKRQALEQP